MNTQYQNKLDSLCGTTQGNILLLEAAYWFEHRGARWILGIPDSAINSARLQHIRDEIDHSESVLTLSTRLKTKLTFLDQSRITSSLTGVHQAAQSYLSKLRKAVLKCKLRAQAKPTSSVDDKIAYYESIALLIERRLMKFYPALAKLSPEADIVPEIQRLIADEREHLTLVRGASAKSDFQNLKCLEEKLAQDLVSQLYGFISNARDREVAHA